MPIVCIAILFAMPSQPHSFGQSQGPRREITTLTLDQALALAEQHNPRLHAAAAQLEGAHAGIRTARAYPNPEFKFMGGAQAPFLSSAMAGAYRDYTFTQPIELGSVRRSRIRAAELRRDSSDFGLAETRLGVRAVVKQAFYDVLRRKGEVSLARETLKLIEDLRQRVQVQVDVGEAARLELIRAESEVATARVLANSARLRQVTAVATLEAALGVPLSNDFEPAGELQPPTVLPPIEKLQEEMLTQYPAIAQTQAQIRRSEALLENERAQRKPRPSIETETERMPDNYLTRVGIILPLPIWNRREGPIAEAAAAVKEARALAEQRRNELVAGLEVAYGLHQTATQQVASFQDGVLREAEAAVKAAEAAYRFGERGILDVLDAQRVLRNVRFDFLNAQFDRQAALIELERLRAVEMGRRP